LKRKSHRRVYEILKEWGVQEYEVIDKKALQEITLGASVLAIGAALSSYQLINACLCQRE